MKRKIINIIKNIISKFNYYHTYLIELKNINSKKKLVKSVRLSNSQKLEIKKFYKIHYGKNISTMWHRLYQSYTSHYDKKYFPEILFSTKLEKIINNYKICSFYENKALVDILYGNIDGLSIPKTILLNCEGIWYDCNNNIISVKQAFKIIKNSGEVIIKKIIDSCSGRNITTCKIENGKILENNISIEELLIKYDKNFIIQRKICNCDEIKKIYSKSLNTLRIITYTINGKIYHVPLTLRIGKDNSNVDNIHAGGMFIGVSDDGFLLEKAFTENQKKYYEHPNTKIKFKNYYIPNVSSAINLAYKCHQQTPGVGLASWDFALGQDNKIYLIEANLTGQSIWFPQMAHGKSAFGDNTEYMLELISTKKKKV